MRIEFIILNLLITINYLLFNNNLTLILFYLTFCVCEGVILLTLLILIIKNYGNDSNNFYNLLLW